MRTVGAAVGATVGAAVVTTAGAAVDRATVDGGAVGAGGAGVAAGVGAGVGAGVAMTFTVPLIAVWIEQRYAKLPAVAIVIVRL